MLLYTRLSVQFGLERSGDMELYRVILPQPTPLTQKTATCMHGECCRFSLYLAPLKRRLAPNKAD